MEAPEAETHPQTPTPTLLIAYQADLEVNSKSAGSQQIPVLLHPNCPRKRVPVQERARLPDLKAGQQLQSPLQGAPTQSTFDKILEFFLDISDKLLGSQSSGLSDTKKSLSRQHEYKNMTSIRLHPSDIEAVLRDLLLSSQALSDENQIWDVAQTFLNDLQPRARKKRNKHLLVQRSLRGYLGLLNEVLHARHVFHAKMQTHLGLKKYSTTRECLYQSREEELRSLVKAVDFEVGLRNRTLREMFAAEWAAIGQMKKDLERLVENCRICERRVKVFDLVRHSDLCEKYFKLKDQFFQVGRHFLGLSEKFGRFVHENSQVYLPEQK